MSLESPVSVLFNSDGYEIAVKDGLALAANSAALLIAGSDGTDTHYISLDSDGRQLVVGAGSAGTPAGGVLSIQGTAGLGDELKVMGHVDVDNFPADFSVIQDNASELLASVGGLGAAGAALVGNPVRIGGSDGSNTTDILTDASGRLISVGAADAGAAPAGAPVRMGASDGSLTTDILSDSAGRLISVGAAAAGDAVAGAPVRMGGSDGTDTTDILTDTAGRLVMVGAAADGAALAGAPVRIGASDGTNTQDVLSDDQGRLIMVGAAAAGSAPSGNPVLMAGWDGTNVQTFKLDSNGALQINEVKPASAAVSSSSCSTSSAELLASNANREGAMVYNDSNRPLYIKLGGAASTSSFSVKVGAMGYFEVPSGFTGAVHGIWGDADASGAARCTELEA